MSREFVAQSPELTVVALIPSSRARHFIVENGRLPRRLYEGPGTYEAVLRDLGRQTIGLPVSPDYAHYFPGPDPDSPGSVFYFTQPVNPEDVQLQDGVEWLGAPESPQLEQSGPKWWRNLPIAS